MGSDLGSVIDNWMKSHMKIVLFGVGTVAGVAINNPLTELITVKYFTEGLWLAAPAFVVSLGTYEDIKQATKVGGILYIGTLVGQTISEGVKYFLN